MMPTSSVRLTIKRFRVPYTRPIATIGASATRHGSGSRATPSARTTTRGLNCL
jgi:hypothetical protein